jgi:hypothetical protein
MFLAESPLRPRPVGTKYLSLISLLDIKTYAMATPVAVAQSVCICYSKPSEPDPSRLGRGAIQIHKRYRKKS